MFISRKLLNAKLNERSSPAIAGRPFYHFIFVCVCVLLGEFLHQQLHSGCVRLQRQIKSIFLSASESALSLTSLFPEQADADDCSGVITAPFQTFCAHLYQFIAGVCVCARRVISLTHRCVALSLLSAGFFCMSKSINFDMCVSPQSSYNSVMSE